MATTSDIILAVVTGTPATIAAFLAYRASQHASEAKKEAKAGRIIGQAIDKAVNSRPPGQSTIGDDVTSILERPADYPTPPEAIT
jgi:TctA family transporter